jgi:hypothetical protein
MGQFLKLLGVLFLMGLSALGGYCFSPQMGKINWSYILDRLSAPDRHSSLPQPSQTSQKTGVSKKMITLTNILMGTDVSGDFATLEDLCKAVDGGGGGLESCARLR